MRRKERNVMGMSFFMCCSIFSSLSDNLYVLPSDSGDFLSVRTSATAVNRTQIIPKASNAVTTPPFGTTFMLMRTVRMDVSRNEVRTASDLFLGSAIGIMHRIVVVIRGMKYLTRYGMAFRSSFNANEIVVKLPVLREMISV